jgi:hypothetical protein
MVTVRAVAAQCCVDRSLAARLRAPAQLGVRIDNSNPLKLAEFALLLGCQYALDALWWDGP